MNLELIQHIQEDVFKKPTKKDLVGRVAQVDAQKIARKEWRDEILRTIEQRTGIKGITDITHESDDPVRAEEHKKISLSVPCYRVIRRSIPREENELPSIGGWYITAFTEKRIKDIVGCLNANAIESFILQPRYSYERSTITASNDSSSSHAFLKALWENDPQAFL